MSHLTLLLFDIAYGLFIVEIHNCNSEWEMHEQVCYRCRVMNSLFFFFLTFFFFQQ